MNMASTKRSTTYPAYDVIVIGGGAAGMLSAATAALACKRVLLIEKNQKLGRKLSITGKGRCNVTNDCEPDEVLKNVPTNGRFLYSSVWSFPPSEVKKLFEAYGGSLKPERGKRVFPVSDRAGDIVAALEELLHRRGVHVLRDTVTDILSENGAVTAVRMGEKILRTSSAILATGGKSYPLTGSTGDGYGFAEKLGHTVTEISGSLVPLELVGGEDRRMAGLSLRNISLKLYGSKKKKPIYEDFGEALFMNYGISGPVILSASAHMREKDGPFSLEIDLKPALDEKKLDARMLRDFSDRQNDRLYDGLRGLLPAQLIPVILDRCGLSSDRMVNSVTREERRRILTCIKGLRFEVAGKRPVDEAIITHGGVKVSEVDPKTMESKLVKGLYFAGEILDCDAYTGGFNLQIAWSTAVAAGSSCSNFDKNVL